MPSNNISLLELDEGIIVKCFKCNEEGDASNYVHDMADVKDKNCKSICIKCFGPEKYKETCRAYDNKMKLQLLDSGVDHCKICYETKRLLPCTDNSGDIFLCLYCFKHLTEIGHTNCSNIKKEVKHCFLCKDENEEDLVDCTTENDESYTFCSLCFSKL